MKVFNLYKKAKWGWYHVTSFKFENLAQAITFYKKEFGAKIGNKDCNYKVTGL
jgi:hypothetical protein